MLFRSPQLAKWITLLTGWLIRARNDTRQPKGLPLSGGLCLRDQHWGLRQVGLHPTSADPGMMGSRWTETNQDRRQSNGSFDPTDDSGPPCRSYVGESRVATANLQRLLRAQTNFCPISLRLWCRGPQWLSRVTGNQGSIPEREPEKRLPLLRQAAGAQIAHCKHTCEAATRNGSAVGPL